MHKLLTKKEEKENDIIGIGSPLLDIIINVDDETLLDFNLKKGQMHLISGEKSQSILEAINDANKEFLAGGSVANTISGASVVGNRASLVGVIGRDDYGDIYKKQTVDGDVVDKLKKHKKHSTGHAITFITPDQERTFATHLGAAAAIRKDHIADVDTEIKKSKILHVEAYQLEDPKTRDAVIHAMDIAKNSDVLVSVDLSDAALIKRTGNLFKDIIHEYVNVVFANECEAREFSGKHEKDAVHDIAKICDVAVVKLGKDGSMIKKGKEVYKIEAQPVKEINTNGAGDMYAAGIIHGIINGLDAKEAGNIASHLAALVVASPGARLDKRHYTDIEKYKIKK